MYMKAGIVFVLIVLYGCSSGREMSAQLGAGQNQQRTSAAGSADLTGARDVINLSPSLAMTGSGVFAVFVMLIMLLSFRRRDRALKTIIRAVENTPSSAPVKQQITRQSLSEKTADFIHGQISRLNTPSLI